MTTTQTRKLFLNLAIKDLARSRAFFSSLGFTFNEQFCSDNGLCMVLSNDGYVMLLEEARFKDFTKRDICDTRTHVEGLFALSADSREEVDAVIAKALAAGGSEAHDLQDHGFMYGRSFYDLDGHHWEIFWMDLAAVPAPAETADSARA
ncbi:MAG TPA: VOC family protein [Luteitalea sp.]|nr:VOC family protein [Luteitalea sp.]